MYEANYEDVVERAHSFLNFEGYVGVECKFCYMPNNVLQNPNGWWCGCGFYNRGNTGSNLPYKKPKYVEKVDNVEEILEHPDELIMSFDEEVYHAIPCNN